MKPERIAKRWLPPAVFGLLGRFMRRSPRFVGGWTSWAEAAKGSRGYDSESILQQVAKATRAVESGKYAFERDSVLFSEWFPRFEILAPLLRHALRHDGKLEVIDFGGALGSTFRQCLPFLPEFSEFKWHVVEQPKFADLGRLEFESSSLYFHKDLTTLPLTGSPRLLLASSVLQYLPDPAKFIEEWERSDIDTLVIDRTPVHYGHGDDICIQHVPRHIYDASYPCWVLSREDLLNRLSAKWRLLCEFDSPEGSHPVSGGRKLHFKGFILERRKS